MIEVKSLGNQGFTINAFLIEKIESFPDTTITLTNGKKYVVINSNAEVTLKCIDFFKSVYQIDYKSQFLEKKLTKMNEGN